ncbi:MAG TPA: RDD family protein [Edaphobacter sp.]
MRLRVSNLAVSTVVISILGGFLVKAAWTEVPVTYGYSMETVNGKSHVAGGTHPALFVATAIFAVLYYWMPKAEPRVNSAAKMGRRMLASIIDFLVVVFVGAGLTGLVAVLVERQRTGEFAWTFERDYLTPTDSYVGFPLVILTMVCMFLYFVVALVRGRQTIGDYIADIQTFTADGRREFRFGEGCKRVLVGMKARSPFAWFRSVGINGRASYEEGMGTRVLVVRSSSYKW